MTSGSQEGAQNSEELRSLQYVHGGSTRHGRTSPANNLLSRPVGLRKHLPPPQERAQFLHLATSGKGVQIRDASLSHGDKVSARVGVRTRGLAAMSSASAASPSVASSSSSSSWQQLRASSFS